MAQGTGELFLPNLLTFTNGNRFLGSFCGLRFQVAPAAAEEDREARLEVLCWYGENCLEESEIRAETAFPLTAEGRTQVIDWLKAQQAQMPEDEQSKEYNDKNGV